MFDALDLRELLADELVERVESGYALDGLATEVRAALEGSPLPLTEVERLYGELESTGLRPDWAYQEPSGLDGDPGAHAGRWAEPAASHQRAARPGPRRMARALCRVQPGQAG